MQLQSSIPADPVGARGPRRRVFAVTLSAAGAESEAPTRQPRQLPSNLFVGSAFVVRLVARELFGCSLPVLGAAVASATVLWEAFVTPFEDTWDRHKKGRLTAEEPGELPGMSARHFPGDRGALRGRGRRRSA
jgi:hypothetical protein